MAKIIELKEGELVPINTWYQMYGPPFTGDPLDYVMFSFKAKFGHYPEIIYVAGNQTYFAQHRGKPQRKEDREKI